MRPSLLLSLLAALAPAAATAAPGWASKPDSADEKGHLFVCSGEGKSEQDALDSALAICSDKICKLCGVEVESTTVTKETLTGVDLQRKVVERCRRVRKAEPQLRAKSLECEEGRCQGFVQLFYSREAEKAECAAFAREDFAGPELCEADVEVFRRQQGISAASLRARTAQLDAALAHCAQIDVRPTPALLALDVKLRAGIGGIGSDGRRDDRAADAYLGNFGPALQAIAETNTLLGRLQQARALVANRALAMEVIEAAMAPDCDSPAGVARWLAALQAAPLGGAYGAPDPHFFRVVLLPDFKSDTTAIAAFLRNAYLPEKPPPGMDGEEWSLVSRAMAADGRVTPEEWDLGLRATRLRLCSACLPQLLRAGDHGGREVRLARFVEGVEAQRAAFGARMSRPGYGIYELLPHGDPVFVLEAEEVVQAEWKASFDYELYGHVTGSFRSLQPPGDQQRALRRWSEKAAVPGRGGDPCRELPRRLEALRRAEAPRVPALDQAVCDCLDGALAAEERGQKKEALQYALDGGLACVGGP